MRENTREWIMYASADLRNCEKILDDEFLTNIVAFHSQQAVEKCFKAIIEELHLKFERVHNLFKLHSIIEDSLNFSVDIDILELLDKIYTSSRYPVGIGLTPYGKPSLDDSKRFYLFAKFIFDETCRQLNDNHFEC